MQRPDYHFYVADPQLGGTYGGSNLVLRFQTVEVSNGRPERSGKFVQLELTSAFAMQLLGQLQAVQKLLALPEPQKPARVEVPKREHQN